MSDKFSFYQTDGLWGIIENASNEKQTSIKSYFGSDLIIKRLNEQADQIDQLKQQLVELEQELVKEVCEKIRSELENELKYDFTSYVPIMNVCNKINRVLDQIQKEYEK